MRCTTSSNHEEASSGSRRFSPESSGAHHGSGPLRSAQDSSSVLSNSSSASDTTSSVTGSSICRVSHCDHGSLPTPANSRAPATTDSRTSNAGRPPAGDNGAHRFSNVRRSSSCSCSSTIAALFEGGVRGVPRGSRMGVSEEISSTSCALCRNQPLALARGGRNREECVSAWTPKGEGDPRELHPAAWTRLPRKEGSGDAKTQSAACGGVLFSSALLLWLLAPFLYLNELTKLRLLSKSLNSRWLSLYRLRWMMCNSVAFVFPGQWDLPSHQFRHHHHHHQRGGYCSPRLQLPHASSGEEVHEHQQQQLRNQQGEEQHECNKKQQQQQYREAREEQDKQQQTAEVEKRELKGMLQEPVKRETREAQQQRQRQCWKQQEGGGRIQRLKLHLEIRQQELQAEQSLRQREEEHQQPRVTPTLFEKTTPAAQTSVVSPLHSPAAPCSSSPVAAAAAGIEAAGGSAFSATLHGGSLSSRQPAPLLACDGKAARLTAPPASSSMSAPSNTEAENEEEVATAGACCTGGPRGERQVEAHTLRGATPQARDSEEGSGRVAVGSTPEAPFPSNFLQAMLLRPPSYGCAALQLRQLTLHMPESPKAVLSLQQFRTYKDILELCSPTLEELCLIDFSSFYIVVDVSPALEDLLQTRESTGGTAAAEGAAAACGLSSAAVNELKTALSIVNSAFRPLPEPPTAGDESGATAGEAAASPTEVTPAAQSPTDVPTSGAAEKSAPAAASSGKQPDESALPGSPPRQLTLSFKIWDCCRSALEEDITEDDEIQAIEDAEEESSDGDTVSPLREGESAGARTAWSANSFGDPAATIAPSSCSSCGVEDGSQGPTPSSGLATIGRAAPRIAEGTERLEPQEAARQYGAAVVTAARAAAADCVPSSPVAAPPTAEGAREERSMDSMGSEAAVGAPFFLAQKEATSGGELRRKAGFSKESHALSREDGDEHRGHSAAALMSSVAVPVATAAASVTAVGRANAFCRGGGRLPCGVAMHCGLSRIPAATEVYQLVHNTVRSLKLNCRFPQLKRLYVYGYAEWKMARPYFSCLACLFLPRDSASLQHTAENSGYNEERSDVDAQGRGSSSRSTRRKDSSDESHRSDIKEIRSSSTQQSRSRTGCGLARSGRISSSNSSRQNHSRSSSRVCSASPRNRNERSTSASNTPKRGCREPSSSGGCSLDSQRRRGRSRSLRGKDRGVISKGKKDDVGDAVAGSDATSSVLDCSSARVSVVAREGKGGNGGEKAKGTVPESAPAFPNLEELSWLDASCVAEDMCNFILASQTQRLQKLSFSTYCPSTISLLLEKCVSHPRLFRNLRQLDIDGLNFIWRDDEWWWFTGNSWTRFVEIWRLHAINRYHLARTYPVPRTLQQLEAERRQQQQRCRQHRGDACTAGDVQRHRKKRQPSDHGRRHHHRRGGRGVDPISSKERILKSTQKLLTQFQEHKEGHVLEREVVRSGGSGDVERKDPAREGTGEGDGHTAEINECAERVCRSAWLGGMVEVDDEARRLSETEKWGVCRERSSNSRRSDGRRGLEAEGASLRRWRCSDDWSTDEEKHEESKSQQSQELPVGFVGMAGDVDYEGIKRALDRLPRVRKLRLLSFTGDVLGVRDDSTRTLGCFFPEADQEIQGSVFIPRRLFQQFLMKIIHKVPAAEKRDRKQSIKRSADENVCSWGRALRALRVACSGSVGGVKQQHKERQSSLFLHSASSSDAQGGGSSSDDSFANTSLEFGTPSAVSCPTVQSVVGSVTNRLLSEEPVTSRTDVLLEWRRLISEEVRLNPDQVGQEYVVRWLRHGLVYKVTMTLAIPLGGRAELRVDAFHQQCVSEYIGDVLAGMPHLKRQRSVGAKHVNSLRILELTDCIQETSTPLEGYKDARGYFVPFGRVKDVLAYFTPFLLGLNCFSPYIRLQCGEADEEDSTCWPAQDIFREVGRELSQNDAAREDPGDEDEDLKSAEEAHRMDSQIHRSSGRGSWKAEERFKMGQRRRTVHVGCGLARNVYAGGIQHKETNKVLHRRTLSAEESCGHASSFSETCRDRPRRATVVEFPSRYLEDAAPLMQVDENERDADDEELSSRGRAFTAGQRGTEMETWPVSPASGGARDTRRATKTDDGPLPDEHLPETSLRILRLKGVVGLALPLYTRFIDYRRLGDLVRQVARAYRAQTRVLLVTNGTLLFYKRNKTHHDVALAALARDFKAVTKECMESLQIIDYRVYRPITWRCELGENQEHRYMPAFLRAFLRHNPQFRLARRLDCIPPVDNELEFDLQRVKSTLTAYLWIKRR